MDKTINQNRSRLLDRLYKGSKGLALAIAIGGYALSLSPNEDLNKMGRISFYSSAMYIIGTELVEATSKRTRGLVKKIKKWD